MTRVIFLIGVATLVSGGCGVVGAPMPPEDVGVAPIIERQKNREAAAAGRSRETPLSSQQTMGSAVDAGGAAQPADNLPVPPIESVGTGVGDTMR
jgi:hypothetical protein